MILSGKRLPGSVLTPFVWMLAVASLSLLIGCAFPKQKSQIPKVNIQLRNPLPTERKNIPVALTVQQVRQIAPDFAMDAYVVVDPNQSGELIPSQAEDTDYDSVLDTLIFLVDIGPEQTRELVIHYEPQDKQFTLGYDRRTRAGIFPELKGPVWESEKSAYRLLRGNTVDVLGKQETGLQLNNWVTQAREGVRLPSLLSESPIGVGSFRLWDKKVLEMDANPYLRLLVNGPVRSSIQMIGEGFRADLTIYAGQSWMEYRIHSGGTGVAAMLPAESKLIRNEADGFVYTWGQQTTDGSNDWLGLALFYSPAQLMDVAERLDDPLVPGQAHVLKLKPDVDGLVTYRALATWDHGHEGIQDEQAFVKQLRQLAEEFQNPLDVQLSLPPDDSKKEK